MFEPAVRELEESGRLVGATRPFQEYAREHGFKYKNTASCISIDELARLDKHLLASSCMVFRLGRAPSSKNLTQFALAKFQQREDFFLIDRDVFGKMEKEPFLPSVSVRSLYAYQLIPSLTETSLINLGFASGLIQKALGIDGNSGQTIPATGQTTFTFEVKPLASDPETWTHNQGQVEIDGLFVGSRKGQEQLFVIEAKSSNNLASIAKHKIVYPVLALASKIPSYIPIVPVYIRCIRQDGAVFFHVAEMEFSDPRKSQVSVQSLSVRAARIFSLHGF